MGQELHRPATNEGYWISPSGQIMLVNQTHVYMIWKQPEVFGLTSEEVLQTYEKYGEKFPEEKRAREVLIRKVLHQGWIRARRYRSGWTMNLHERCASSMALVGMWAQALQAGHQGIQEVDPYIPVCVDTSVSQQTYEFHELASGVHGGKAVRSL